MSFPPTTIFHNNKYDEDDASMTEPKPTETEKPSDEIGTKRISFEFPPRAHNRLKSLKIKTESKTYAEVIRQSLRLYEWVIENNEKGAVLQLQCKDGSTKDVEMLLNR